jgi:hypothetical protein
MLLIVIFIVASLLCVIKPQYGVAMIFIFWVFYSNAYQSNLFLYDKQVSTPFSIIGYSGFKLIDQQGLRFLILVLFLSVLFRGIQNELKELWLLKIIGVIVFISLISIPINDINWADGLSSLSILIINLLFLFSVLNIEFSEKYINNLLLISFYFLIFNSFLQIYQFLFFADGDVDLTFGLLSSTIPTPTISYIVSFLFLGKLLNAKLDKYILGAIFISVVQLVSSYLKGLIGFVLILLLAFKRFLFSGYKIAILSTVTLIIIGGVSAYIFTDVVTDYTIFSAFLNTENITNIGPIRVWTQYAEDVQDTPLSLIIGYGPSSYGSLNTSDLFGFGKSKLGNLLEIPGELSGRSLWGSALSSAGNILWEFGIINLILFFYVYYSLYKRASFIFKETDQVLIRSYAFSVKYLILFILFLYFTAVAGTTEEFFTWGHLFVVYSFINSSAVENKSLKENVPTVSDLT